MHIHRNVVKVLIWKLQLKRHERIYSSADVIASQACYLLFNLSRLKHIPKNPSSWSVIRYRTDNRESLNFPLMEELCPTTFFSSVKNIRLRPLKFENTKWK